MAIGSTSRTARDCALYHFSLQYLEEKGYKKALMGWSRPFLRDGVLQFKKKWSQRITDGHDSGFALQLLSPTPAVKAFLCNNPFIYKNRGRFYGAVFADGAKPLSSEDVRQIDKDYYHPGLSRLLVYCFGQEKPPLPGPVPPELAEHIEVRCAAQLRGGFFAAEAPPATPARQAPQQPVECG